MRPLKRKPDTSGSSAASAKGSTGRQAIILKVIPQERAIDFIKAGNFEGLQEMIAQAGEDTAFLNLVHTKTGRHPLAVAAEEGRQLETEILIGAKVEIDKRDQHGMTALMYAAKNGEPDILKMLLDAGADLEAEHEASQESLLFMAAKNRHYNVVKQLIDLGREVEVVNVKQETPLWNAIKMDQFDLARLLLQFGGNINVTRPGGDSLLLVSCFQGYNLPQVEFLLDNGAFVGHQNESGVSAFMLCARHGHDQVLQRLLAHCQSRQEEIVKARAVAVEYGGSPLEYVKLPNMRDVDYHQLVNMADAGGKTALMYAAIHQQTGCLEQLVQLAHLDVFAQDQWGYTALMFAARVPNFATLSLTQQRNALRIVELLVERDPEGRHFNEFLDKSFNNVLAHACIKGNVLIAERLLESGCGNYVQQNIDEKTPVDLLEAAEDRNFLLDAVTRHEAALRRDGDPSVLERHQQINNVKVKPRWLRNLNRELYGSSV